MLNQIVIAGRLVGNPEIITTENNKKKTLITVAVPRSYKNIDGNYDTDFIRCTLWNGIAESTCEYCKKGDVVAIKGRLQTSSYEKDDERKFVTDVVAEKVSFLSQARKADEEVK
jgi:single-strand DNA-binding protein